MQLMDAQSLRDLVASVFCSRGVPVADCAIVAGSLVHANLRGTDSHGVLRVPHYIRRLDAGSINPAPGHRLEKTGPSTVMLDGDNGLGHVNVHHAMGAAIEMARESGLAFVSVRNSSHCGALSFFAYQALRADMIALVLTQTDSGVVPYGGRRPFFGTNPLCIAAPSRSGPPLVLDMATSTVAGGQIYSARAQNRPIPDTWALDADGTPTTDPHKAALWTPAAGAKGYALGAMIDVLTGVLAGGHFGPHIPVMYGDYDRPRELCHLACAIDYHRFGGRDTFLDQVAAIIHELHEQPAADGFAEVLAPGEPEHRRAIERERDGIPIPESVLAELNSLLDRGRAPA